MDALSVLNRHFSTQIMFESFTTFCVLLYSFILDVFGFITKHIHRVWAVDEMKFNSIVFDEVDDDDKALEKSESDGFIEKGFSEFSFGIKFENVKDLTQEFSETECSVSKLESSVSKYQFMSGKDISGYIQGPETMSFSIEESFGGFVEKELVLYSGITRNQDLEEQDFEGLRKGEFDQFIDLNVSDIKNDQELISAAEFLYQDQGEDCSKSSCSSEEVLKEKEGLNSEIDELSRNINEEIISTSSSSSSDEDLTFNKFNFDNIEDEFIELEPHLHHSVDGVVPRTLLSERDTMGMFGLVEDLVKESSDEDLNDQNCGDEFARQPLDGLKNSEERCPEKKKSFEWENVEEEEDEEDILMEHKYLIEQMKMDSKHSRTGGLPTILEESETMKISEDLKPLQIDETFEHSDYMEEIQKFYKSYSGKMRKMDILNYQTMHAISFIQLKEPVKIISSQKSVVSAMKSMFLPNFYSSKLRKIYVAQTMKKSMIDLRRDLERVYVGQVCVSWEILHWQYTKAHELEEHNLQDCYTYNQVAGEFQQFQVLLQRFIEDELFQGPRVQNYVNKRHVIVSLLQVPIIKDDCFKNKAVRENDAISISVLKEIIEEAMRVFWEFLRADKHEATLRSKRFHSTKFDHQDAAVDLELLMNIKSKLHKKEKRLKEILRNSNCIVKKLQKHQGGRVKQDLLICQVELRLVSRVVHMSRCTTDQLIWCQSKLNKINFVNRKFSVVEPSFLLFPC